MNHVLENNVLSKFKLSKKFQNTLFYSAYNRGTQFNLIKRFEYLRN